MRKHIKHDFTLMELLAVIAIVSILFTVMLPGFKKMLTGNSVDRAAGDLKLGLEKAQAEAISSRRYVALILGNNSISNLPANYQLGGYRIAYVRKDLDDSGKQEFIFDSWLPETTWKTANPEARLIKIIADTKNFSESPFLNSNTERTGIKVGSGATPQSIAIASINLDGLQKVKKYDNTNATPEAAVIFSPYNGIAGGKNLQFIITECIEDDQKLYFPNRDTDGPLNYIVLQLNCYTGRLSYVTLKDE